MAVAFDRAETSSATLSLEDTTVIIDAVFTGKISAMWPGGPKSAIYKRAQAGRVLVTQLGLTGDEQADKRLHGGPERAVLHYALENYAQWRSRFPAERAQFVGGSFGENISTLGFTEDNVCVGDKYRLGSALVEVAQPRRPCRKLGLRFDIDKLPLLAQETAMTGWYYRVLEEGGLQKGDTVTLVERQAARISVREFWRICTPPLDIVRLREAAGVAALADTWKTWIASKLRARDA
jgi:MOSC domain-containing protein YiiM